MKIITSSRRQIVMAVLLGLATLGAALRYGAEDPSLLRDIGTLLMVLWLPAVGNVVAFIIGKLPRRAPGQKRDMFPADSSFSPQLRAELSPLSLIHGSPQDIDPLDRRCTLILGNQGFSARLAAPVSEWLYAGTAQTLDLELLRPEVALRRLPAGAAFHVLAGTVAVGKGRVIGLSAGAP